MPVWLFVFRCRLTVKIGSLGERTIFGHDVRVVHLFDPSNRRVMTADAEFTGCPTPRCLGDLVDDSVSRICF
jgi:hypothetical protein